jgi:hypothetical protein
MHKFNVDSAKHLMKITNTNLTILHLIIKDTHDSDESAGKRQPDSSGRRLWND